MARETFDTGIGMCRPLYYEYPESEEAYKYEGEYFFGNDILVAPITEPALEDGISSKEIWFPEGKWWSVATDELIDRAEKQCVLRRSKFRIFLNKVQLFLIILLL